MPAFISPQIEVVDEYEAVQELYLERGWSDGLPIVPPTLRRVAAMIASTALDAQHVVAEIPPIWGSATIEKLAINSVMAGCLPAHFPVVIAAVEAMSDPASNH